LEGKNTVGIDLPKYMRAKEGTGVADN